MTAITRYNKAHRPRPGKQPATRLHRPAGPADIPQSYLNHQCDCLTPDGTLGLNYIGLISPIVSAIQALDREITSLANTIAGFAQSFTTNTLNSQQDNTHELCITNSAGTPVCITGDQLTSLLSGQPAVQISASTTTISSVSTTTPPTIIINGDNPAIIEVGNSYTDLGATVGDTGPDQTGDENLGNKTFLNGTLVPNIVIDTSQVATDTVDYVATDSAGFTATSTRNIIIEAVATSISQ